MTPFITIVGAHTLQGSWESNFPIRCQVSENVTRTQSLGNPRR